MTKETKPVVAIPATLQDIAKIGWPVEGTSVTNPFTGSVHAMEDFTIHEEYVYQGDTLRGRVLVGPKLAVII